MSLMYVWYRLCKSDHREVREWMKKQGEKLSGRMKFIPFWDSLMKPYIMHQVDVLFAGGSGFIEGLVSDNDNLNNIQAEIVEMQHHVKHELEVLNDVVQMES